MLTPGAHDPARFPSCDEGVYRLYTIEEQGGKHPGDAIFLLFSVENVIVF